MWNIQITILLILCAYLSPFDEVYISFGFENAEKPVLFGLITICLFILAPLNAFFEVLQNTVSRSYEYEADQYSLILGHENDLCKSLVKIKLDNLNFPVEDHLVCMWHSTHPTLIQRITALKLNRSD